MYKKILLLPLQSLIMKKSVFLLAVCGLFFFQIAYCQKFNEYEKEDMNIADPGVDFVIAGGIFFGNTKTANYYSGWSQNELNLDYVFKNNYWKDDITRLISSKYPGIGVSGQEFCVSEYPAEVNYRLGMSVSVGASYRFDENWRLSIYYTFVRLTAKSGFNVSWDNRVPGNQYPQFLTYLLIGKENRSMIDVMGSYTFQCHKNIKPFIELGGQFNFVRVKSFDAIIENQEFTLMDKYGGSSYVPGASMQQYKKNYGGPGYAVSGAAGVKFAFSKSVSIDPCFYITFGTIGLNGYKSFHFNYGAMVRLVFSDSLFQK